MIYNGDFEEYSSCPENATLTLQNPQEIEKCLGWNSPTFGTSDYLNTCSTNTYSSIPINYFGEQNPFNGQGYLGAYFYSTFDNVNMWWEYIQGTLTETLELGKIYSLKIRISLSDESKKAINEFGALFLGHKLNALSSANLDVEPHCIFDSSFFADKEGWMEVEQIFIASGIEKFIVIGNFKNLTDTGQTDLSDGNNNSAYYFIDGVELIDVTEEYPIPNVFSPNSDGINDEWSVPFSLKNHEILILNRWGNLVTILDFENPIWKGLTSDNSDCSDGVYFYVIRKIKNGRKIRTGNITIVR